LMTGTIYHCCPVKRMVKSLEAITDRASRE
jgi:hypothetical protein